MARWKLAVAHYLNTPGEEWEYVENDRTTGRPKRVKFPVPRLLDPKDPTCWNSKWGNKDNEDGEIIVCFEGRGEPKDIIFYGDPTPDMIPVDDEAKEISAKFEERWRYKPEEFSGEYSQSLIDKFQGEIIEAQTRPVEIPGLADLASAVAKIAEQNAELIKTTVRRV